MRYSASHRLYARWISSHCSARLPRNVRFGFYQADLLWTPLEYALLKLPTQDDRVLQRRYNTQHQPLCVLSSRRFILVEARAKLLCRSRIGLPLTAAGLSAA